MRIYFDTETTGLVPGSDQVIQIGAIITDDNDKILSLIDEYYYTDRTIAQAAMLTHGIDKLSLKRLSDGKYLEDKLFTIKDFFTGNNVFIGHNISFDLRMLNGTLAPYTKIIDKGHQVSSIPKHIPDGNLNYCTMRTLGKLLGYSKAQKLPNLFKNHNKIAVSNPDLLFKSLCDKFKVASNMMAHDALYDAFMTFMLVQSNRELVFDN